MKKFQELIADVWKKHPTDSFFPDFGSSNWADQERVRHYQCYDEALSLLDDESWEIFKGKAVEQYENERQGQKKQAFFNQLNEAFAYRQLLRCGFQEVRFIKEGKKKSPDIRYLDGGAESYCEVKTLGISNDEIKRREGHKAYDGKVYLELDTGFLNKFAADVDRGWEQIRSFGEKGLVFVLVRFDDFSGDYYERYREQLTEFCRTRDFRNSVIKIGHMGDEIIHI